MNFLAFHLVALMIMGKEETTMKKALKITGIVFGILLVFSALSLFISGFVFVGTADAVAKQMVENDPKMAYEAARGVCVGMGTAFIISAIIVTLGAVFSFVLAAKSKADFPKKGTFIALGVLAILTGAEVPGVIAIIHGAKNGN